MRPDSEQVPLDTSDEAPVRPSHVTANDSLLAREADRFASRDGATETGTGSLFSDATVQGRSPAPVESGRSIESFQAELQRAELAENALRLRRASVIAIVLWPLFFASDWLMATYVHQGSFVTYAAIRSLAWISITAGALWIHRTREPSRLQIILVDTMVYASPSIAISVMCALFGRVSSPYAAGIVVVMICRGAFVALPLRDALLPVSLGTLSYPAIMLGAGLYSSELARSLANPAELSIFVFHTGLLITTQFATLYGGQALWRLRQQVFEARNLGRYQLTRPLGKGGMGEVWAARHRTLKRDVAVKILRTDRMSQVALARFEREVQATTELSHPNTVRVFDYGETDDGLWYYVMELLDGEDLARAVAREGAFESARTVHLMLQLSGALAEAHARGIVHRDLKPENVFLCRAAGVADFVKVLDFGIVKRADEATALQLTNVDRVLGTPAYMSPEVALGGQADTRSDVYGLGGLFYFLLTGHAPFEATGDTAQLVARTVLEPVRPSIRRGIEIAPELESVVMRCLSRNAEQRYADAGELLEALRTLALEVPPVRLVR